MKNDTTAIKQQISKLKFFFYDLNADNIEQFYKNKLNQYYYYKSREVENQHGEDILRGFERFFNTLPSKRKDLSKEDVPVTEFRADGKTPEKGYDIDEKDFIDNELFEIENLCKGINLAKNLDLKKSIEAYHGLLIHKTSLLQSTQSLPSKQPQMELSELNPTERAECSKYKFDISKIEQVYHFCIETEVIDGKITNMDFLNAVNNVDFKVIQANAEQKNAKGKSMYIIFILSHHIKEKASEWYQKTACSINTEPSRCSGMGVPSDWKRKANTLK